MGKRIIQQARGHGSFTYRVKRKAFRLKLQYPKKLKGEGTVVKLLNSTGHTAPIAKVIHSDGVFYMPASEGMFEGQKINFEKPEKGSIAQLEDISLKTKIFDIESRPGDGGVFVRTAGNSATINRKIGNNIFVLMPSKKEKKFNKNCRAVIGVAAGAGRLDKPIVKAGKQHYIKKSKNRLWPRTSALKMNVVDHPFGSGRGKNPKSKIAKRDAPPGAKVGLIRPRRTGRRKK